MSLRRLPRLSVTNRSDLGFETSPKALQKWDAGISAYAPAENTISILEPIGSDFFGEGVTAKRIAAALRAIGDQEIFVNMNSPGGDYFEGIAIYNLFREHARKVTVRILSLAASAASVVAMAGDRIEIARAGQVFIHNAQGVVAGDRNDMQEFAEILAQFDAAITELYAARTGQDPKAIARMLDNETMLTGQAVIDKGFADGFLPADAVGSRVTNEARFEFDAVMRRIDVIMAQAGVTRSERRNLLSELKSGTPRAADDATPSAGVNPELLSVLSRIDIPIQS